MYSDLTFFLVNLSSKARNFDKVMQSSEPQISLVARKPIFTNNTVA